MLINFLRIFYVAIDFSFIVGWFPGLTGLWHVIDFKRPVSEGESA